MPRGVYSRKAAMPDMKTAKRAAALAKKVRETGTYELEPEFKRKPDGTTIKLSDLKTPPKESPLVAAADLSAAVGASAPMLAPLDPAILTDGGAPAEPKPPEPVVAAAGPSEPSTQDGPPAPLREPVTPVHLIRMTHPDNGSADGFQTDASGAILVPHIMVSELKAHGFVVDHAAADMAVEEEAEEGV